MKNLLLLFALISLYGCGGSSSSGTGGQDIPHERVMETGETYLVYKGDRIVKTSEDASVAISHTEGSAPTTTVTLLSGTAMLIHN